jgi:hypothetical protein
LTTSEKAEPRILTRDERIALQASCAAGNIPTLDQIRDFIHTTRVSFLSRKAAKDAQGKVTKSRVKKAVVDESQVDFF